MNRIELRNLLPTVFSGMEGEPPISESEIWCRDLDFSRPRHYLVCAESGTGKSSLVSFIYGLRTTYSGSILFDGEDIRTFSIDRWSRLRRETLACLPQEMGLFPSLSAIDNIMVKNRLTDRFSAAEINAMLQELELDNRATFPAGRLSIGQQQRVAIIRALAQPFSFILLDEPVSHLDSRNNAAVTAMVERIAAQNSAGIVATSVGNHLRLSDPKKIRL